jgi:protein-S-isoprenylcysteine O-methyltransferase Ste14
MMQALRDYSIAGLWLVWLIYWIIAARGGKPIRRHEGSASRLSHLLPLAFGLALLLPRHLPDGWLTFRVVPPGTFWFWMGFVLVAVGLGFAIAARIWLGGNWSGVVTLKEDHALIRSGPYRWVRHPIYTGLLVALLGSVIALGEARGLIALLLFAVAFLRRVTIEERLLGEEFGSVYSRYRRDVPALVPIRWRR